MTFHKIITSAANDEMKSLARLLDNARERRKQQLLVLEGLHLLQAALDAGLPLHAVYVNEAAQQHPEWLALHSRSGPLAVGLEQAVRQMKALVQNPRREPLFGQRHP